MEFIKLHKESVAEPLWSLLLSLMQSPKLNEFRLVGGTALALHLGHRQSVDLFSDTFFDASCVIDSLVTTHDPIALDNSTWPEIKNKILTATKEILKS